MSTPLRIKEAIRADWDDSERFAAFYDSEFDKIHCDNDMEPLTKREWNGVDRRKSERRGYVFSGVLTENDLTAGEQWTSAVVFLGAAFVLGFALVGVWHVWRYWI